MTCEEFKSSVVNWFGAEIECRPSGEDSLTATLPILKPNGDPLEIGIESISRQRCKISDLGDTYATLYLAGVDLYEEYVRAEEFRQIKLAHEMEDAEQELSVEVSSAEVASRVFDFAHAIQSMLALQLTLKAKQPSRDFASVVAKFLAERRASFEILPENIEGKTGRWKFNFVLNHLQKETLVKAITAGNKNQALGLAERSVFEIRDVKELRPSIETRCQVFWHREKLFAEFSAKFCKSHAIKGARVAIMIAYLTLRDNYLLGTQE